MAKRILTGVKGFYTLLGGQLVSTIGSGMTRFGLGVWVLTETGNVAAYTMLLFFAVFPAGLGSLVAGPFIDRWDRRKVMIAANVVASLSTLGIALLFYLNALEVWHLYISMSINGVANAFISPTLQSSVPLLVPKEHLNRASGLSQLIRALEAIVAPGLAGFVVASFNVGIIFLIDFLTFGAAILALTLIEIPNPRRAKDAVRTNFWQDFTFGFRYIQQHPPFMILLSLFSVTMFLLPGVGYSLVSPLVLSFSTEDVLGMVMAMYGIGSIIGSVLMAVVTGKFRRMHIILSAMATAGLAAILLSLRANAWLIGIGFFITGISFIFIVSLNRVIWQVKAAPEVQGRLFSLMAAIGVGAQSLGILITGPLANNLFEPLMAEGGALANSVGTFLGTGPGRGIALMFVIIGLLELVVVLVSSLMPSVRLLEDKLPDQEFDAIISRSRRSAR